MRLFPAEIDVGPNEGFSPEKDIFGRKQFGERLTNIVTATEGPSVFLLDAPWGTGKTTFVKMWRGELTKAGVSSIYFDAFANDYQSDAFLAVAGQIIAEADRLVGSEKEALKTFRKEALRTAGVIGRASVRFAIRAATAGLIEGEGLEKAAADIAKGAGEESSKALDEILKERLDNYAKDQAIFKSFREALQKLSTSTNREDTNKVGDQEQISRKPVIFVIDELDRCRPLFALELLEKIKHFFSVEGFVFVIVCSFEQLQCAVNYAYGDIDSQTYLEKFYNMRILLPLNSISASNDNIDTYLRHLRCDHDFSEIISKFAKVKPLSFRTIDRIVTYYNVAKISSRKRLITEVIGVLCIIKVTYPKLYDRARMSKMTLADIESYFSFSDWQADRSGPVKTGVSIRIEGWMRFCLEKGDGSQNEGFERRLWDYDGIDRPEVVPYYCDLIDGFSFPGQ